jgi:RND family efflux transporter MFP subunit
MKLLTRILALSLAVNGASACGASHDQPGELARDPVDVTVVPVVAVDTAERLEAGGVVAARETASVSSRIVATVVSVRVRAGDHVRAGDVLVTLDAREVVERTHQARASAVAAEQSLAQARAGQSAAEAEHRLASAWHQGVAALHARHSATDQERDEAAARLAAAAAGAEGARAAIGLADANLAAAQATVGAAAATESYTIVRAPFDGLITERFTDPGNLAAPGVPLLQVESDGTRQVVVRVDEARAAYVQPGDAVEVEIDRRRESSGDGKMLQGTVAEVARAVGADQRAFTVKITVPLTVAARSGTFARVVFRGRPRRALLVPESAIHRHGQVSSVYVVQDGVARLRLIQAGSAATAGVEILAGLEAGESVVTSPVSRIADGTRVAVGATRTPAGGRP